MWYRLDSRADLRDVYGSGINIYDMVLFQVKDSQSTKADDITTIKKQFTNFKDQKTLLEVSVDILFSVFWPSQLL